MELARGPARSHPRRLLHDTVDVAAALRPGVNVVGVLVRFYGEPTAWWMPAVPTFSHGAGCLVAEVDLPGGVLAPTGPGALPVSDAWTRQRPSGLGQARPEVLDGRRSTRTGCGRATRTRLVGAPRGHRAAPRGHRPVGPAHRPVRADAAACHRAAGRDAEDPGRAAAAPARHAREPVTLPLTVDLDAGSPEVVTADFGRVVAGTLALRLTGPAGVVADGSLVERPGRRGRAVAAERRVLLTRCADTRHVRDRRTGGGRYAVLRLTGSGRVTVDAVTVHERLRPRPPGPFFTCSDPLLDEIHRSACGPST
ncbi:hypothetical protein [Micromonospora sp. b486]|uniref:hypothetical protein n=1 Tax=Micromonospora sp. b486 TaxID=3053986 RepID=UPI00259CEB52|nr:hypothetical protein [Micromonospora sp. b486]MDM4784438.1 hypothetical protein [Micromonospora sp. b486]